MGKNEYDDDTDEATMNKMKQKQDKIV